MTLEEIEKLWGEDAKIDRTNLGEEAANVPQLLQKWGAIIYKPEYKRLYELRKERTKTRLMLEEALTGVMTEKEIMELGITINIPHGLSVKRNNADRAMVERYIQTNPMMEKIEDKVFQQELKIKFIEMHLDSIKYRGNTIRDLMQYNQWTEGFN